MQNNHEKAQWFWLSKKDPWSHTEADRWKPYTRAENRVIEQAYQGNKETVGAGDYIVDLTQNIQYKISEESKQRPVKRKIYN